MFSTLSTLSRNSIDESLPNITGSAAGIRRMDTLQSGANSALYWVFLNYPDALTVHSATGAADIGINASRSSSTYQDNAHVRPLSTTTAFLIRY